MNPQIDILQGSESNFPIRESYFYNEIKSSTETGDSTSFALLMSMLTNDALELDEFHVPQRQNEQYLDDLKKQFFIQDKPVIKRSDEQRSVMLNELIHQGFKTSVELDLFLKPEGLVEESIQIPQRVLENIEPNVRAKLDINNPTSNETNTKLNNKNQIDVESWFNVLSESRVFSTAA